MVFKATWSVYWAFPMGMLLLAAGTGQSSYICPSPPPAPFPDDTTNLGAECAVPIEQTCPGTDLPKCLCTDVVQLKFFKIENGTDVLVGYVCADEVKCVGA